MPEQSKIREERKINWDRIMISILIMLFVFTFGIFLGYIAGLLVKSTSLSLSDEIKNQILEIELQKEITNSYPCSEAGIDSLTDKLDYLGGLVKVLEQKYGYSNADTKEMKKLYTLLELQHYLLVKEKISKCGKNYEVILFFYSNEPEMLGASKSMGDMISYVRRKYSFLRVYSFDSAINLDSLDTLKQAYNVKNYPSVVVGNVTLDRVSSSEDIEKYIPKKS